MGLWQSRVSGSGALVIALGMAFPVTAQPIGATGTVAADARVIDIRAEDDCLAGSVPGARCLPAEWLLDGGGGTPIGFHALRWLFGTIGLTGREKLIVYSGPQGITDEALAVAALAHLAGQSRVFVHDGTTVDTADGGEGRSFSREAVYTAPMRTDLMAVSDETGPLRNRLIDFALGGGAVGFGSQR
ncbi:MAG: hypothetical protein K8H74_01820 [Notoacmeibacter sp.]|nr:hypothetical protein [Notoacmeibacter sp.]